MKYIVISDLHFKHNRLPAEHLAESLRLMFDGISNILPEVDVIFIAGDLTDTGISAHDPELLTLLNWLNWLLDLCVEYDIALRVLEGTASHDLRQGRIIHALPTVKKINFKYIDKPYIENLFDKDILYVPDDWASSRDILDRDIEDVLKENNLHEVDIAILHGLFDYQLPDIPTHVAFNEEYMLKIVKGYISIGHHHVYKPKGRIVPQGSFDRMSFNEEEDKGGVYIDTEIQGYKRLINKNALIFRDIDVSEMKDVSEIEPILIDSPKGSWFRLVGPSSCTLISTLEDIKNTFPEQNITSKKPKEEKAKIVKAPTELASVVVLNRKTLLGAFIEHLEDKEYSDEDITKSKTLLSSVIEGEEQ